MKKGVALCVGLVKINFARDARVQQQRKELLLICIVSRAIMRPSRHVVRNYSSHSLVNQFSWRARYGKDFHRSIDGLNASNFALPSTWTRASVISLSMMAFRESVK